MKVIKGGEIIPKIIGVDLARRNAELLPPRFPSVCPDCGTPLVRAEDEAKWFCPNQDGCPMQIKGRLLHFVGRKAMDVLAGDATVDQLYGLGLVRTPADFYDLTEGRLLLLEGWKERSAARFLESLDASRRVPFERVLFALGIRFVGETTAKAIAAHFGSVDAIAEATADDLLQVPDVGDVIAQSVRAYFRDPRHLADLDRLKAAGLQFSLQARPVASAALAGMSVVVSGVFSRSRDEMKALVERNGGKNSSSVSSKTSFLLAGEKPGPEKVKKANDLGVKIVSETEFMAMLPRSVEAVSVQTPDDQGPTLFG